MSISVPVLTNDHSTRRQIARALFAGGMDVRFLERPQDVLQVAVDAQVAMLLIDADTVDLDQVEKVLHQLRGDQKSALPVVLLSVGHDRARLTELLERFEIGNLVAKHDTSRASHPMLDERELLVTCQKVLRRDIFGIEKYVGGWGTAVHRAKLTSMADKYRVLSEFEGFLTDLELPTMVVPDILTVADEFMLNAVVHAPRDAHGKPRYEHLEPSPLLLLNANEFVDVAYACDGQRLMLSVSDNFGALSRETLQSYVSKGFRSEKRRVEMKASGAGLGLSMAFLNIHQLVFNIHENFRTEAMAGWYLRVNNAQEFRNVSKSLNCFWVNHQQTVLTAPPPEPLPRSHKSIPNPGAALRHLRGHVDETAGALLTPDVRRVDLRSVTGFSSRGLMAWMKFLASVEGRTVEVYAVPEVMVRFAAEIPTLLSSVWVHSLLAATRCIRCDNEAMVEVPPAEVPHGDLGVCQPCGGELRFTGPEAAYERLLETLKPIAR